MFTFILLAMPICIPIFLSTLMGDGFFTPVSVTPRTSPPKSIRRTSLELPPALLTEYLSQSLSSLAFWVA